MQTYGDMIREARNAHGWTQKELADNSGVPKRTIQEIENGRVARPHRETRILLNQALDIGGDPVRERAEWPEDVGEIVDIVAAWLVLQAPADRIRWFGAFMRDTGKPSTEE